MKARWSSCSVLVALLLFGCASPDRQNPVVPGDAGPLCAVSSPEPAVSSNRYLWGIWTIQVDPISQTAFVSPDRSAQMHLNAVKMLETTCSDCLKISNVKVVAPAEVSVDVTLKHPFPANLGLTAFDVRAIFITDADWTGDDSFAVGKGLPLLLNPDGYTKLFNPTDYPQSLPDPPALKYFHGEHSTSDDLSADLNPFVAFSQDKPRRMFLPGTQETKQMLLHVPTGPFEFGYAVDACWAPPINKPVIDPEKDFPPNANCLEPYKISVSVGDGLDEWIESSTQVCVDVFRHQGPESSWAISGGAFSSGSYFDYSDITSTITPEGNLRIFETIRSTIWLKAGEYHIKLRYVGSDSSDPNFQNVSAYQKATVIVHPMGEHVPIVKADANPKAQSVGVPVHFWDTGTHDPDGDDLVKWEWDWEGDGVYDAEGKDILHAFDTPGDYPVRLRVTDSDGQAGVLETPLEIHVKTVIGWARTWGGGSNYGDAATAVATDETGNIYVSSSFCGEVDFDPGPGGAFEHSTGNWDGSIGKFDKDGNFLWVRIFRSVFGGPDTLVHTWDVAVDKDGNVYMAGEFNSPVDFDPGASEDIHYENGATDAFLLKLTADGSYEWCRTWGGTSWDDAFSIAIGQSGEIWIGGEFRGTADLDPGPGEDIRVSNGGGDAFLTKFDSSGNFLWAATWGGNDSPQSDDGEDFVKALAIDSLGNVYAAGEGKSSSQDQPVDYDPGPGTDFQARGYFLSKFDPSGTYQWVYLTYSYLSSSGFMTNSMAVDGEDNLYLTGLFGGPFDFDPGPGVEEHDDNGGGDVYLLKLDSSGGFVWVRTWGGNNSGTGLREEGLDCAVDSQGDVFVTGMWYGICDFDPGLGVAEHKSFFDACEGRMFLSKFSSQGDFQWADVWGYPCDIYDYERAAGVAATPGGSAYVVGQFAKTTDFDPGPGEDLHTVTGYPYYVGNDCYLTKFPPDGIW